MLAHRFLPLFALALNLLLLGSALARTAASAAIASSRGSPRRSTSGT
jgi:hypothetical protein